MDLHGRRIHIAGSTDPEEDEDKLAYAHTLVMELATQLAQSGAHFVLPFGGEPLLKERDDGPSIIFDWTVAEAIHRALQAGQAQPSGPNGRIITSLATRKSVDKIPPARRDLYEDLRNRNAVDLEFLKQGWTAGALQRQRQAQVGDVLIAISGGQGVEHLAVEYSSRGKPVIPLDIHLGSSGHDGSGGAARLFDRALDEPANFFHLSDGESAADLLDKTRTAEGTVDVNKCVSAIMKLLSALAPPRVFYVRLLNETLAEYKLVERFFRDTVDPLVRELGYEPCQMGVGENEFAWMNQAIFDTLHHSAVVLVDLTTLRPNCFLEMGYALGNRQRVIVTALEGTALPFDASAIEVFFWKEAEGALERMGRLRAHWARNINMPGLVRPREAK